jgi:LPXTG-site transpeptidase (sortase) family protein
MGRSGRLIAALRQGRSQFVGLFRRYPRVAFPLSGAVALSAVALVVLAVFVVAFRGGSFSGRDVLSDSITATPDSTLTPTATATATATVVMEAAAVTPSSGSTGQGSSSGGPASESGMRFKIPSIGVDAPVTIRLMGSDGVMGEPNGRFDVVWYDFSAFPGMGGYPGAGGNAVFAGHVDYHPHYEAVFWDLHLVGPGDIIEVDLPDGTLIRYTVQWSRQIGPDDDFSGYVTRTGEDIMTIVTCQGTFNSATHNYDHRLVVRGIRQ